MLVGGFMTWVQVHARRRELRHDAETQSLASLFMPKVQEDMSLAIELLRLSSTEIWLRMAIVASALRERVRAASKL